MKVYVERTKDTKKLKFTGKANDLLTKLNINSEEVLVVRNGGLVTSDTKLVNSDEIKIISVISGG